MAERTMTATSATIVQYSDLGPGAKFVGSASEVRRLMRLGYLRDPRRRVVRHGAQRGPLLVVAD
jgi:hypothetical protein